MRINIRFVNENINHNLNWFLISKSPDITMENIESTIDDHRYKYEFSYISMNKNLTFDFLVKYINKDWNWKEISSIIIISQEQLEKSFIYSKIKWNFKELSKNPYLKLETVKKYHNYNWDFKYIFKNLVINQN